MGPTLVPGITALGLWYAAFNSFEDAIQAVVAEVVDTAITSPSPATPTGRVSALFLINIRFMCGVAKYGDLAPIWMEVTRV